MKIRGLCLAALLWSLSASAADPRIAIVMDDLGYQLTLSRRVVALPGPVVCAILPAAPHANLIATLAHQRGKEVLLHLPLQAIKPAHDTEPNVITVDMSQQQVSRIFTAALAAVPFVEGVSNHRGSLLTQHPGDMAWLMDDINAQQPLFFLDSFTTARSVALEIAQERHVRALRRDVFLDPDQEPATIQREFQRLLRLAREHSHAIAIGHPYPGTLDFLERELPRLADEGIVLVPLSALLPAASGS